MSNVHQPSAVHIKTVRRERTAAGVMRGVSA